MIKQRDKKIASLVGQQTTLHLLGAWAFSPRLDLGVALPVILHQAGDQVDQLRGDNALAETGGPGDARVVTRYVLVTQQSPSSKLGFSLAALLDLGLPTGDRNDYRGDGWAVEPKLAAGYARDSLSVDANLGWTLRPDQRNNNVERTDALSWAVAARIPVTQAFRVIPEFVGSAGLAADEINAEEVPVEGRLGGEFAVDRWAIGGGVGVGLVSGPGVPDWRVFGGITWRSEAPPVLPSDLDGDRIADVDDQCPNIAEDYDGDRDTDGCLDADRDEDSHPDTYDVCLEEKENLDGYRDGDGCPEEKPEQRAQAPAPTQPSK